MDNNTLGNILKEEIIEYILTPINNNSDLIISTIIGTITNDIELKISKNNNTWTEIKVLIETEHPRRVQLKLFGDNAKEAVKKYHKGDIIFVIGEPKPNSFVPKNGKDIINRLDVFPILIKKLGNKEVQDNKPIVLK